MEIVQANSTGRAPLTAADYGFVKTGYTIEEVLPLLPFGRTTLWNFISSGELPVMRFGRRVSLTTPDLVDLLNKRRGAFTPFDPSAQ